MKTALIGITCAAAYVGAGLLSPVSAQTTTTTEESYYVVQDVKTKKCTIVREKPTSSVQFTILGDGALFKTRTEAESGMKTYKVCTTE
jgi:hypothetical protein